MGKDAGCAEQDQSICQLSRRGGSESSSCQRGDHFRRAAVHVFRTPPSLHHMHLEKISKSCSSWHARLPASRSLVETRRPEHGRRHLGSWRHHDVLTVKVNGVYVEFETHFSTDIFHVLNNLISLSQLRVSFGVRLQR